MKQYKLYLFDIDGTLFDTIEANTRVFREAYKAIGVDVSDEECLIFTRIPIPTGYYEMKKCKEEDADVFIARLRETLHDETTIKLTKDFYDTLDIFNYLHNHNIDMGIVTSNQIYHTKLILDKFNVPHDWFKVFVGEENTTNPKPSPEPMLTALDIYGDKEISKSDVIYVGDALNDCISAQNAGIEYVLLDRNDEYKDSKFPRIKSLRDLYE